MHGELLPPSRPSQLTESFAGSNDTKFPHDTRLSFPRVGSSGLELWARFETLCGTSPSLKTLLQSDFAEGTRRTSKDSSDEDLTGDDAKEGGNPMAKEERTSDTLEDSEGRRDRRVHGRVKSRQVARGKGQRRLHLPRDQGHPGGVLDLQSNPLLDSNLPHRVHARRARLSRPLSCPPTSPRRKPASSTSNPGDAKIC
jgi:hypothetical protein